MIRLPIVADPNYSMIINLEGFEVTFYFRWHTSTNSWLVDIEIDQINKTIRGLKIATGQDLLKGHAVSDLGVLLPVDDVGNEDPNFDDFGDRFNLVYYTVAEVAAINAG